MLSPVVVVTGASRGMGAAIAQISASLGAKVVLGGRSARDLDQQVKKIKSLNGQAISVVGDLSKNIECHRLIEKAYKAFGRIDTLINNGGIIEPIEPISKATMNEWGKNLTINLLTPVILTQAAIPYLRDSSGRVINISSGAAVKVVQGWGAYSASKAALNHFTKILAEEEPLLTALAVRPGVIDTAMQVMIREKGKLGMPEAAYNNSLNQYRDGKLLSPDLPGRAVAVLGLRAPHEWSGDFIQWDEERVKALLM